MDIATALVIMENGYLHLPEGGGLGIKLFPDVSRRPDALVRRTGENTIV